MKQKRNWGVLSMLSYVGVLLVGLGFAGNSHAAGLGTNARGAIAPADVKGHKVRGVIGSSTRHKIHHKSVSAKIIGNRLYLLNKNGTKRLAPNDLYHVGTSGLIEVRGGRIIRNTVAPFSVKKLKGVGGVVTPNC